MLEKYVKSAELLYGRLIRVWVLIFPFFAITHPEDLQTVLSSKKHTEKIFFYKLLHNFLGNGLITSSGEFMFQPFKVLYFFHCVLRQQLKNSIESDLILHYSCNCLYLFRFRLLIIGSWWMESASTINSANISCYYTGTIPWHFYWCVKCAHWSIEKRPKSTQYYILGEPMRHWYIER